MDERLPFSKNDPVDLLIVKITPGFKLQILPRAGAVGLNLQRFFIAPRPAACEEIRYVQCTEFGIEGLTDRIPVIQLGRSH